jgi:hypothetical protein
LSALGNPHKGLLRVLTACGVKFIVIGGVAAQVHGWQGATLDLDITVSTTEDNVRRLNSALKQLGAGPPAVGAFGTAFQTRLGRLEVVGRADGIGEYEDWARRAQSETVERGLSILVADPGDVVRSKEAAGRAKDLDVLPQIRIDLGLD